MSPSEYERRFSMDRLWRALARTPDFFGQLPLKAGALRLYQGVRHLRPAILTGLPRGDWAEPQKRRWAARHFPGVEMITTQAALKCRHCHPGDVLVDDQDRYRDLWEAEGGRFVLPHSAEKSLVALAALGFPVKATAEP
jgi:hypothetical protein